MSLYDLIRKRRDRIIAIWREEGARVAAGDSMPARELVDTLPVYLDELAASLEAEACGQPQPVSGQLAATHGVTRRRGPSLGLLRLVVTVLNVAGARRARNVCTSDRTQERRDCYCCDKHPP